MRKMRVVVLLVVVILPGLMLAPAWRLSGLGAGEDDILYYYPARVFFHETIRNGHWPWLNPWTGLGRPFVADPQTAPWYPFTWLFALMPPLWAYPVSLWAHYSLALWGMYRLLRALAFDRRAALFGGITFAFSGFLLAHRAHFTMQHAAAWAPWVIWRLHRYALSGAAASETRRARGTLRLASAAAVFALQCFAGHVQIAAFTAVGALLLLLAQRRQAAERGAGHTRPWLVATRWLIACVCATGLFAVQWLPTLAYLRLCTRVEQTYSDFVENSWNPASALGWLLPMFFGQRTPNFFDQPYWGPSHQVEQFGYAGLLPLVLAALALRRGWRFDPRRRPWVILGLFGLLLALGGYGLICRVLYWLPASGLFRCPARALLLVNLSVAALVAVTFQDLGPGLSPRRVRLRATLIRWTRHPLAISVLLIGAPLVLFLAALPLMDVELRAAAVRALRPWNPAVWLPLLTALISLTALGLVVRRWRRPQLLWLLSVITAVDLGVIGWTIDVPPGPGNPVELLTPRQAADWMVPVRQSPHRLWVVTSRHGRTPGEYVESVDKAVANTNVLRRIASLSDYGPLQPRAVVQRFGFQPWGEAWDAESLLASTGWMRLYNVGWVLLCDDHRPAPPGCDLATTTAAGWRLYRNTHAAGPALFEDATQPGAVRFTRHSPSAFTTLVDTWPTRATIDPSASQPATMERWPRLVVAQLALPGWRAYVSGQAVAIEVVDGVLMGVRVPPGEAVEINWSYFPPGLQAGAVISLVCTVVLAVSALGSRSRRAIVRQAVGQAESSRPATVAAKRS